VRLHDRRVNCPNEYVLCDSSVEDSMHFFFLITIVYIVSKKIGLWNSIVQVVNVNRSMVENVFTLLQVLSTDQLATFACILWSIWKQSDHTHCSV
jgi:hypothetical protein